MFEAFVKKVFGIGISVKRVDGEFSRAREAEGSCGFRGTHDKPIVILEEPQPQMPQPVDQTKQQSKGHSQEEAYPGLLTGGVEADVMAANELATDAFLQI